MYTFYQNARKLAYNEKICVNFTQYFLCIFFKITHSFVIITGIEVNFMSIRKKTSSVKALEIALVNLLDHHEVSEITIQKLCNEADINRSTFYLHFHDLGELIKSIETDLKENIAFHLSAEQGLGQSLISLMDYMSERRIFFKVFLDPKNHGEVKRYLDFHVLNAIESEYDLGDDIVYRNYLKVFMISGLWYMTFDWIQAGCQLQPKELAGLMLQFINKLATR